MRPRASIRAARPLRRGSTLLYAVLTMPVLIGFASFAVDWGRLQLAKVELRQAADAGARYAAAGLHSGPTTVAARAKQAAAENTVDGSPVAAADVSAEYGRYDYASKTFIPLAVSSYDANAVRVTVTRSVQTTFRGAIGANSAVSVKGTSVAYIPGALLVVGNAGSLPAKDSAVRSTLWSQGYSIRTTSATATQASDAAGCAVVVISESISSGDLNSKLRDVAIPVVCYEPFVFDDMRMTGTASDQFGWAPNDTQILWVQPSLLGGYSGPYAVNNAAVQVAFGKPGPSAFILSTSTGDSSRATFFLYEKGQSMVGMTAPHRRVGMFIGDASQLNNNGWNLFNAAVAYAVGSGRTVVTVK